MRKQYEILNLAEPGKTNKQKNNNLASSTGHTADLKEIAFFLLFLTKP